MLEAVFEKGMIPRVGTGGGSGSGSGSAGGSGGGGGGGEWGEVVRVLTVGKVSFD